MSPLALHRDAHLARLAAAGDERAFALLFRRHEARLRRYAQGFLTPAAAEDAVQQAFIAAWQALGAGRQIDEPLAWLHRVVRNQGLMILRAGGREETLDDAAQAGDGPDDVVERLEEARRMLAAVAALPERQRVALVGTALHGRSQAELAEDLGVSGGALRQLVHRARVTVRETAAALVPAPAAARLAALMQPASAASAPVRIAATAAAGALLVTAPVVLVRPARAPAHRTQRARALAAVPGAAPTRTPAPRRPTPAPAVLARAPLPRRVAARPAASPAPAPVTHIKQRTRPLPVAARRPAPSADDPPAADNDPAAPVDDPAPDATDPAPVDDDPSAQAAADDDPAPVQDDPVPVEADPAPAEEDPVPVEEGP